ncbi:pseudouridine synthase [Gordonia phthalatica]|uniref:RNA pseudouridylate synthase n=1 Tax=Gordonia phthalatica TaxID=1136941 RepID=A0A0N9NHY5_9ACTN|nr:pseudouridine synthase [Gordonia phthalatica]ALG85444.1 pseudouridine synthase [Gordonia phthalatica]
MRPPLPVKDGVGPTRLRIPSDGSWPTVGAFLIDRFPHLDPTEVERRLAAGEFVGIDGAVVTQHTALGEHEFVWYYREIPNEEPLPYRETVLHVDDDLIVIDKPHFLPTTPGGRYLRESALVRLRLAFDNPDITPIHRLDRPTAGLVMFSTRPDTRGLYQTLFAERRVSKTYEAVSALPDDWNPSTPTAAGHAFPITYRNRIVRDRDAQGFGLRVAVDEGGAPNAETTIEAIGAGTSRTGRRVVHTALHPKTGRTHQLRVHLSALGIPILGDRWYPDLLPEAPDDPSLPLQLLARELRFTDPLTGRSRTFISGMDLSERPVDGDVAPTPGAPR